MNKRTFYQIIPKEDKQYELGILSGNAPYNKQIEVALESYFGYINEIDYLYSVETSKATLFESILSKEKIKFTKMNLDDEYATYLDNCTPNETSSIEKDYKIDESIVVGIFEITQIICGAGESQLLLEKTIIKKDKIKVRVNTKEKGKHHLPHAHIDYNSEENYCIISLMNYSVIKPDNFHNAKIKKIIELLKGVEQKARKQWNMSDSDSKIHTKQVKDGSKEKTFYLNTFSTCIGHNES